MMVIELIFFNLSRATKRFIVLFLDVFLSFFSVWIAFYLRLGDWISFSDSYWNLSYALLISLSILIPIASYFGFYHAIFRYAGYSSLKVISKAFVLYGALYASVICFFSFPGIPRTIGFIQPIALYFFIALSRIAASSLIRGYLNNKPSEIKLHRALVYGTGSAGRELVNALKNNREIQILGFIDDNPSLSKSTIDSYPIFDPQELVKIVSKKKVTLILLAIPSVSREKRNKILKDLEGIQVAVRTLPSVMDLVENKLNQFQIIL
jgi:FlaA1/EpsC-like NDP-sugar epimerase